MKYIILFFSFIIFVNGCIPKKKKSIHLTIKETTTDTTNYIPEDTSFAAMMSDTTGIDSVQLALQKIVLPKTVSFIDTIETLTMKGSFDYASSGKSFQAGIYVRIQRDSIIWLSISYLGFEVARVFATPKEVLIYNKVNGKIENMSFNQLLKQQNLPLYFADPFKVIQSFFFGSYLIKHTDSIQNTSITQEYLLFNTIPQSNISTITKVSLKDKVYYPMNIQIPEVLNYVLQIHYEDWNLVKQNRFFSMTRKLSIYDIENTRRPITNLTIYFTDAKFNEKTSFPFPNIGSYTP